MTRHSVSWLRRGAALVLLAVLVAVTAGCQWRGLNSVPLPGTGGGGDGSIKIQAQLPDVGYLQPNSRVLVGDVNVGTVTKIERQGWHALVTMTLDSDVDLPSNVAVKLGQTSLLGSLHLELAPSVEEAPTGKLRNGSLIPLSSAGTYPTTDQTLTALSMLLSGGGIGQVQDITQAFSTAFAGREQDLRSLIVQLDEFVGRLDGQTGDIIASTESLNSLVSQLAEQKPILDQALRQIPDALAVVSERRENLTEAFDSFGRFSALTRDSVDQTKKALVTELNDMGPVFASLADAGPALTRSLDLLTTFPFPKSTIENWIRGDYANFDLILDLTLSRLDNGLLTGTRFECGLTELELQWGRTIGQIPSPCTAGNPLVAPYRGNQGP